MVEPWMSGSYPEVDALLRPVLHSFDHAKLDLDTWTEGLTAQQLWAKPLGMGALGFHIRHIGGSVDRLFTYAKGEMLTEAQLAELKNEEAPGADRRQLLSELHTILDRVAAEVRTINPDTLKEPRSIGRKKLPTTLGGLLVHMAEHTQRHVGEAIVTAKVVRQY